MTNESLLRWVLPDKPVDSTIVRVLRTVDPIAREAGCAYFIAGATARDLILVNVHGLRAGRATRDMDFGIAVESWERFDLLKERLAKTGDFASDQRALQRLTWSDRSTGLSVPVDLIPFRGVASPENTIEWPPSRDIVMNVAGFEEALSSSLSVQIEENLIVRVTSLPGLMLLKLLAWADRKFETNSSNQTIRINQRCCRYLSAPDNLGRGRQHRSALRRRDGFAGGCGF